MRSQLCFKGASAKSIVVRPWTLETLESWCLPLRL